MHLEQLTHFSAFLLSKSVESGLLAGQRMHCGTHVVRILDFRLAEVPSDWHRQNQQKEMERLMSGPHNDADTYVSHVLLPLLGIIIGALLVRRLFVK